MNDEATCGKKTQVRLGEHAMATLECEIGPHDDGYHIATMDVDQLTMSLDNPVPNGKTAAITFTWRSA